MIVNEIIKIAKELNIEISVINRTEPQGESVIKAVSNFGEAGTYPLWDNLKNWIGITHSEGWKLIGDFLNDELQILMFFDGIDDNRIIQINNSNDYLLLLENTYHFTFYLTNEESEFLVCYNDHENIVVSGVAKKWLLDVAESNNIQIFES